MSTLLPTTRARARRLLVTAVCAAAITIPGCGGSESSAENASPEQQKVQELLKKGMNLSQIRKSVKGEPLEEKKTTKKKQRGR